MDLPDPSLLRVSLEAAVPLWIDHFKKFPWGKLEYIIQEFVQIIAEKGDLLMFRSTEKGESAEVFNALAQALAICAFVPGGVTAFGLHFEATHPKLSER